MMKKSLAHVALILTSVFVGIVIVELIWRLCLLLGIKGIETPWERRYMLLRDETGGTVFRNIDNWFLYEPSRSIQSVAYYDTDSGWVREYGYNFRTNNFGLVQVADIDPSREALLLLGDSFTEGQGASPWFEDFSARIADTKYQMVNGGILGTGFEAWLLLHDNLAGRGLKIDRVGVVFISDDYDRIPWNYSERALECVRNYVACNGDEGVYGMPLDHERLIGLERLKDGRMRRTNSTYWIKHNAKQTFSASYMMYKLIRLELEKLSRSAQKVRSADVIRRLIATYGRDVVFIQLPQRDEIMSGISSQGMEVRNTIQDHGGRLYDGFKECGLTLSDYHTIDGHPNKSGYLKISSCVAKAVKQMLHR